MIPHQFALFVRLNLSYHIGKLIYPDFIWSVPNSDKVAYVTFDDGPHAEITPWVLDLLKERDAKASFFVVGSNAEANPQLIERILNEGHSLGNHTQNHVKGWSVPTETYLNDIAACAEVIPETSLFRPPYGRINRGAIPHLTAYRIVMWDNLSRDYIRGLNKRSSLKSLKRKTRPGTISVFHDSEKAEENLKYLLPAYLDYLQREGYELKAL